MIVPPMGELFVWAIVKGMVIGLFAVSVIWGVAVLVEWRISKVTSRNKAHRDVTSDTNRDEERPVSHV